MAWAYKSSAGKLDVKDGRERDSKDKWKQRYFRVSNQPELIVHAPRGTKMT